MGPVAAEVGDIDTARARWEDEGSIHMGKMGFFLISAGKMSPHFRRHWMGAKLWDRERRERWPAAEKVAEKAQRQIEFLLQTNYPGFTHLVVVVGLYLALKIYISPSPFIIYFRKSYSHKIMKKTFFSLYSQCTLLLILEHLSLVCSLSDRNKMGPQQLAVVSPVKLNSDKKWDLTRHFCAVFRPDFDDPLWHVRGKCGFPAAHQGPSVLVGNMASQIR